MAINSKFPFLHHGKEIIMHSRCVLDPPVNLFIHYIVFEVIIGSLRQNVISSVNRAYTSWHRASFLFFFFFFSCVLDSTLIFIMISL